MLAASYACKVLIMDVQLWMYSAYYGCTVMDVQCLLWMYIYGCTLMDVQLWMYRSVLWMYSYGCTVFVMHVQF